MLKSSQQGDPVTYPDFALFFRVVRVRHTGINRADFGALGRIKMSFALNTLIGVDYIGCVTLADGLHRALRLTGSTANALVCNLVGHSIYLLGLSLKNSP